ncbi:MAG TPA: sensor histidine kinase [Actinomycetota bacterium]|nr:sensor histidine kinase [Actinomycetota bacterium]
MQARFPSQTLSRGLLAVGALASAATIAAFAIAFGSDLSGWAWSTPFVGGYVAGAIAFRARPENVAARRLLLSGTAATSWIGASVAVAVGLESYGRTWWLGPANVGVQLLGLVMWAATIALLAVYPDGAYGRVYERRLVRVLAGLAVGVPLALLVCRPALQPAWVFAWDEAAGPTGGWPRIPSPFHVEALAFLGTPLRAYLDSALALSPVIGAIVVWRRYRRLPESGRMQVRWPLFGALVALLTPLSAILQTLGALSLGIGQAIQVCALTALPATVAIGLVKPTLFDVDRALRRSLLYAPLWIAIAGAYVGLAAALGLAASGKGLQLAVLVTIGATLLFEPLRRALARRAARWAYGESLSGDELVQRLGSALEHTLDLERLVSEVAAITREGFGVSWVRIDVDGLEPTVAGDAPAPGEPPTLSARLVQDGRGLGEIACGPRVRGRTRAADKQLLETLARQASLAIHNARLASELAHRLDEIRAQAVELAASRERIVTADESARRRIERDIHDGAQQELVALIARMGLARSELGRDPAGLDDTLVTLQSEVRGALENLRRLVAGIHPAVLTDHGLVEAIEIRSARLPVDVAVECDPETRAARFTDAVEGAAYLFVSEALANVLKHAGATRACVRVSCSDRELEVEVADDGRGFDPRVASHTGLRGLADRIEALGGTVDVESTPQRGTRVTARLPIRDHADA